MKSDNCLYANTRQIASVVAVIQMNFSLLAPPECGARKRYTCRSAGEGGTSVSVKAADYLP